ncbi:hypothetical protein G6F63_012719 [Rhizopus arrhizus]|nr:hypothetical protein G6F63_012719 [Rhizopus arrhizus]
MGLHVRFLVWVVGSTDRLGAGGSAGGVNLGGHLHPEQDSCGHAGAQTGQLGQMAHLVNPCGMRRPRLNLVSDMRTLLLSALSRGHWRTGRGPKRPECVRHVETGPLAARLCGRRTTFRIRDGPYPQESAGVHGLACRRRGCRAGCCRSPSF